MIKIVVPVILVIILILPMSCGESSSNIPKTNPSQQAVSTTTTNLVTTTPPSTSPPPPTTTNQPPPTSNSLIRLSDATNDLFDSESKPLIAEAFLDIIQVEVMLVNGNFVFLMTVNGAIPTVLDTGIAVEWDFFLDADRSPTTGWNYPIACNDIGPDYLIFLDLDGTQITTRILDIKAGTFTQVMGKINGNRVEISFNESMLPSLRSFDFVAAVRKWAKVGTGKNLVVVDKTPGTGHVTYLKT